MKSVTQYPLAAAAFALFFAAAALAGAEAPAQAQAVSPTVQKLSGEQELFKQIQSEYAETIEPIFKQSCFNCHSRYVKYPWNYGLAFVKKKVDEDIADARETLELSDGFPLESRA